MNSKNNAVDKYRRNLNLHILCLPIHSAKPTVHIILPFIQHLNFSTGSIKSHVPYLMEGTVVLAGM